MEWIVQMAEALVIEITRNMSGIQLKRLTESIGEVEMDSVCGLVEGDYNIRMQFRAEPEFFYRLAASMIGDVPSSYEEVQEYATEFLNVLCGRFISEIHRSTRFSATFLPTYFERGPETHYMDNVGKIETITFLSDTRELAEFSWTRTPLARLYHKED